MRGTSLCESVNAAQVFLMKSKWDVWTCFSDWEMCEGAWRAAMGLERRWLQAVTAVAICLISKYAMQIWIHGIHLQFVFSIIHH